MVRIEESPKNRELMALVSLSARKSVDMPDSILLGAFDEDGVPKGALVAEVDEQLVCSIVSLFVVEDSRRKRIATNLVERLQQICVRDRLTGIIAEWAEPEMGEFADFFASLPFAKGKDGNTVFEVPLKEAADFVVPGEGKDAGIAPVSMQGLSSYKRAVWMKRFGVDIHPSLDPHNLGGKLLKNHSYFICDDKGVLGFLLSTRRDKNTVSIAALHMDEGAFKSLPRLLGIGIRSLAAAYPNDTLRFTIASPEAMGIAQKLLKQYPIEPREIRLKRACWNTIEWR